MNPAPPVMRICCGISRSPGRRTRRGTASDRVDTDVSRDLSLKPLGGERHPNRGTYEAAKNIPLPFANAPSGRHGYSPIRKHHHELASSRVVWCGVVLF